MLFLKEKWFEKHKVGHKPQPETSQSEWNNYVFPTPIHREKDLAPDILQVR